MSDDFRVETGFFGHRKTKKLKRRCGAEGMIALLALWGYCTTNHPDGDLSGISDEDIELAADWEGEEGLLISALLDAEYVDGPEGERRLHEWVEHQPYVSTRPQRQVAANKAIQTRWHQKGNHAGHPVAECPLCFPENTPRIRDVSQVDTDRIRGVYDPNTPRIENDTDRNTHLHLTSPSPSPSPSPLSEQQQQLLSGSTSSTTGEAGASPEEIVSGGGLDGQQPDGQQQAGADTAGAGLGTTPGGSAGEGKGGKPKKPPKPPDEFDLAAVGVLEVGWPEIGPDVNRNAVLKKLAAILRRRENKISAAELTGILRWGYDVWRPQGYMSSPGTIDAKKPTESQARWGKLKYGMSINEIDDPATYVPGSFVGRDGKAVRVSAAGGKSRAELDLEARERIAEFGRRANAANPDILAMKKRAADREAREKAAQEQASPQQSPSAA